MLASIIRTVVPVIVGLVVSLALRAGIQLDDASVTSVVTSVVTGVYYVVARFLETRVNPSFGWLLGLAKQPAYDYSAKHAA